ncbi:FHA domain-containing protein [Fictibacillus iocasae]|uniref:FHA domain-containing protein n=1 Tax=Fictibacillus iocasae TaxID=2715437 RepID=A0ABW2NQK8_9BACL
MDRKDYLKIEIGDPYEAGSIIPLTEDKTLSIGRVNPRLMLDVALQSPYVSRNHAEITTENRKVYVRDLGSKHGTELNGAALTPYLKNELKDGDRITLAKGAVCFTFAGGAEADWDMTMELSMPAGGLARMEEGLYIIPERRQVVIDNHHVILSGKHTDLLMLLHARKNQAVSYDEIKIYVWPERLGHGGQAVPDVGNDEITALVYRLRKKLNNYGDKIISLPRYGYMLELEEGKRSPQT